MGGHRRVALTHFAGRAGDHNDRAMAGSRELADVLEARLGTAATVVGEPEAALSAGWEEELAAALPSLRVMAEALDRALREGSAPVSASSRCAVALATVPVVVAHRPDAVVVWFDAHADLNTPRTTTTGYLGGLAFSGPLGLWDSGLGSGLRSENAVLVGARDIDPPERRLIDSGAVTLVPVGPSIAAELRRAVGGRPVYLHIDCDVLEPGIVPTDYVVPGGISLEELRACAAVLAESEIVGLEVAELESSGDSAPQSPAHLPPLLAALEPILSQLAGRAPHGRVRN